MNFKTHFIFSSFAVNEQKVLLYARSAPKNAIFGAFLTDFPPKTVIFSKTGKFLVENLLEKYQKWHFLARFAGIEALFAHLQQKS